VFKRFFKEKTKNQEKSLLNQDISWLNKKIEELKIERKKLLESGGATNFPEIKNLDAEILKLKYALFYKKNINKESEQ
jgi:hypothetical protein